MEDDIYAAAIDSIAVELEQNLDMIILNEPRDMTFPPRYFLDTAYHLTWEGSCERTRRLINALNREFAVTKDINGETD